MIERISSLAATGIGTGRRDAAADDIARSVADRFNAGTAIGTPLREVSGDAAALLAATLGRGGDPVALGRLESAVLDFAREAKALAIGHPERSPQQFAEQVDAAIGAAAAAADALPATFDPVDRAVALLDRAAHHLSSQDQESGS